MKNLLFLLLIIPAMWQCTSGPSAKELRLINDSLMVEAAQKDSQMNFLVETMGNIETNLKLIKEKEKLIAVQSQSGDKNLATGEAINQDIHMIYELMLQNKEYIQNLEKKLNKSTADNIEIRKLIGGLNEQLQAKSLEIVQLQENLQKKNILIDELNYEVMGLSFAIDSVKTINKTTREQLEATKTEANTAFYALGTRKELKNKNIIVRQGFLFFGSDKVLKEDFESEYFTKIDTRTTTELPLYASKAKVLTSHPADSFELTTDENKDLILEITNVAKFWSISKYLVVEVN